MIVAIYAINFISQILIGVLVVRAILSWFVTPQNYRRGGILVKLYSILWQVSEPIIVPFRKLLARVQTGPFDFAPLVAMLAIMLLQRVIVRILTMFL